MTTGPEILERIRSVIVQGTVSGDRMDAGAYRSTDPLLDPGIEPSLVIRPSGVEELQGLVKLGNGSGLNMTVASSTGPHRKGGIAAVRENVLIDLSHWKKISQIDRRNRVCMIEPGVTYGELLKALEPHGMTVPMPLAPRDGKSVIGSVMDREPSTWPNRQWDISDPVASTEVLFGDGELFRTGAAGGPGTLERQRASGGAQKSPLGPSQTDFHRIVQGSQGTIGLVTWITVRTELRPSIEEPLLFGAMDLGSLVPLVYDVQRRMLGEHSFLLDRTAAAMLMSGCGGSEAMPASLPNYLYLQNVAGFERMPKERLEYQLADIGAIAKGRGMDPTTSQGGSEARVLLDAARRPCGEVDWRHRGKGQCLSLFFLTTLDRAPGLFEVFLDLAAEQGVERDSIGLYLQPIVQNHACHVEFLCPFDPSDPRKVEIMRALEKRSARMLSESGAFFSRPYGSAGEIVFERNPLAYEVLRRMKAVFDPNRILNQGKWGL